MVVNPLTTNEFSLTEPDWGLHPIRSFLEDCGFDVRGFPRLHFVIEMRDPQIRASQIYLPISVPKASGLIYESLLRVTRVVEIPSTQINEHRKFLEVEWTISEHPTAADLRHPVFAFLAHEMECPVCKNLFIADAEIIDDTSVRIICPQCVHHWLFRVEKTIDEQRPNVYSLLERFQENPAFMRKKIQDWENIQIGNSNTSDFYDFFPFAFEAWDKATSLEWLFGELQGWTAISQGGRSEFEILAKGFLNSLSLEYFRSAQSPMSANALDTTDVQRKSEIEIRQENQKQAIQEILPSTVPERPITKVSWNPLPAAKVYTGSARRFSISKLGYTAAACISAFALLTGAYYFIPRALNSSKPKLDSSELISESVRSIQNQAPLVEPELNHKTESPSTQTPSLPEKAEEPKNETAIPAPEAPAKPENTLAQKPELKSKAHPIKKELSLEKQKRTAKTEADFREGTQHLRLQQTKEAIMAFKKVISADPTFAPSYREIALAYIYEEKWNDAIHSLENYLRLAKDAKDRPNIVKVLQNLKEQTKKSTAHQ